MAFVCLFDCVWALASDSNLISAPDHPGKVNNKHIQDKNIEGTP